MDRRRVRTSRGGDAMGCKNPWRNSRDPIIRLAHFRHLGVWAIFLILFFVADATEPARAAGSAANVDAARIEGADQDPANWMTYGGGFKAERLYPPIPITNDKVRALGFVLLSQLEETAGPRTATLL